MTGVVTVEEIADLLESGYDSEEGPTRRWCDEMGERIAALVAERSAAVVAAARTEERETYMRWGDVMAGCDIERNGRLYRQVPVVLGKGKTEDQIAVSHLRLRVRESQVAIQALIFMPPDRSKADYRPVRGGPTVEEMLLAALASGDSASEGAQAPPAPERPATAPDEEWIRQARLAALDEAIAVVERWWTRLNGPVLDGQATVCAQIIGEIRVLKEPR